jgi:hypothetical protein
MKKRVIRKLAQAYANIIVAQYKVATDPFKRTMLFDQAATLNAYCIVFHDIYLD